MFESEFPDRFTFVSFAYIGARMTARPTAYLVLNSSAQVVAAFTLDEMPHMGKFDNMHYALGCNGSGVAMMSYLGHQTARKIVGKVNHVCAFDRPEFPDHALYNGNTWFLPWIGRYFRTRDWLDRRFG